MESQIRQNYHRDCEAAVNRMVNMELFASYTYQSMLCDFLEGHFLSRSVEEIKRLGDHVTSLRKLTSCEQQGMMGEYLFDKHTLS
ncbi:Ferritin, middle subunit [Acipenser ruthenus]|uniref:Ferritin, middle subunit n=1 Tax=Acipenser ruthenus TaxID=7906 RepID=A0A444UTN1_ACIRT|nr:Ferritin, middle subunit [Acipenser ruthenus]